MWLGQSKTAVARREADLDVGIVDSSPRVADADVTGEGDRRTEPDRVAMNRSNDGHADLEKRCEEAEPIGGMRPANLNVVVLHHHQIEIATSREVFPVEARTTARTSDIRSRSRNAFVSSMCIVSSMRFMSSGRFSVTMARCHCAQLSGLRTWSVAYVLPGWSLSRTKARLPKNTSQRICQ